MPRVTERRDAHEGFLTYGGPLQMCIDVDRNLPAIHCDAACLPPACNIESPLSAPRHSGASVRIAMEIVGVVMLGSIVLWLSRQFDRHDW